MKILKIRTSHKDPNMDIVLAEVNRYSGKYATFISNKEFGGYQAGEYFHDYREAMISFWDRY